MKKLLGILCVVVWGAFAGSSAALADQADERGVLRVTGLGVVRAAPDMAVIHLGVREEAKEAAAASQAVAMALTKVLAQLKKAGLDEGDIQTTQLTLNPQLDYSGASAPRRVGFEASSTLTITIRDLDRLGTVLDQVMQAGANYFNGLQFDLSTRAATEDQARTEAVTDAIRKATLLAKAAGLSLGPVLSLSEGGASHRPEPAFARMAMEAPSAMPVAPGEMDVSAQVVMEFSLGE